MNRPTATVSLLAAVSLLAVCSKVGAEDPSAQYKVTKTLHVGGAGGWDYATLDDAGKLLYLTRSTHTIVVDTATGKIVADFSKTKRSHGVALVPDVGRGFVSDGGSGTVVIFDLKTHDVLGTVAAADDADGIIYDPASRRVLIACGDAGVLVPIAADVDPKSGKADPPIDLGGKPEFLAADGNGKAYVNIADKNEVAVVDTKAMKVLNKWPTAPGATPTGMSMDAKSGRLYVGCRNQKLIVMNAQDGSVLADLPIGRVNDATVFHDGAALASCGDGTLSLIRETSPSKFEVVQTVQTAPGAKTMAIDHHTGTVYLPTADMEPSNDPRGRPRPLPGTFKVIVVEPSK